MQKKKVAIVSPNILLASGGVRTMAGFIYRILQDSADFEPHMISISTSADDSASIQLRRPDSWFKGVRIEQTEWGGRPVIHVGAVATELEFQRYRPRPTLTELLKRYDLVQVVAGAPAAAYAISAVPRPVCAYFATLVREERVSIIDNATGWRKPWLQIMTEFNASYEQAALENLDHVFALSDYTLNLLAPRVPAERLTRAILGIDTQKFVPAETYQAHGPIISVARFHDPRKNVKMLFEAYIELIARQPDAPDLLLIGGRPSDEAWQLIIDNNLENRVEIIDHAPREQLPEYYAKASLFVLPSNEEGLAIVILEAMAAGLPIVSTRCGGPESIVSDGENGYLTPVGDPDAFANKLHQLTSNPTRKAEFAAASRRLLEEKYSLEVTSRPFLNTYHRLLESANQKDDV